MRTFDSKQRALLASEKIIDAARVLRSDFPMGAKIFSLTSIMDKK
jgi:hypothetical protein